MTAHAPEVVERVREIRRLGARSKEIAEVCGVSANFVWTVTRDLPDPPRRDSVPAETVEQICTMYLKGIPVLTIAKLVNVNKAKVLHIVRKKNLPKRWTASTRAIAMIRRLQREGHGVTEIARRARVSRQTVRKYLVPTINP